MMRKRTWRTRKKTFKRRTNSCQGTGKTKMTSTSSPNFTYSEMNRTVTTTTTSFPAQALFCHLPSNPNTPSRPKSSMRMHSISKPFDWDHPPAFARGVTASGPGHLATPVEDDGIVGSDEYQLETFGTSDLLPTFKSLSQVQTDSEPERLQFDEESKGGVTEPFSHDLAQEYFVTEAEEDERDTDDLGHLDAYTISRSISVDPHHFVVEESLTDHEPDDRGMSLDVATVDGELEDPDAEAPASGDIEETQIRETDSSEDVRRYKPEVRPSFLSHQDSEDARELVATLDSALSGELDTVTQLIESQVPGERNGDASSFLPDDIPMPVLADPTVHDPSALQPPTTPPRVPMILSLPGSPLLLSPVATPAGQPTPVSLPVPASLLKAMHIRSSLFTPNVTAPTTPHPVDHSTPGDSRAVSQTGYFDLTNVKDTIKESQSIPDFSTPVTPLNGHDTEDPTKFSEAVNDEAMVDVFPDVAAEIEQTDTVGAMQEDASHGEEDVVPEPELQQLTPIEELSSDVVSSEEIAREVETTLPHAEQDAVPEAELQQLTHIEEIPADMASSEETDHERIETPALEAALPDEEQYDVPEAELQQLTHVATDMASSEDINYDHTEAVTTEAYLPREEELAVAHGGGPTATPEVNEVTSPSYSEEMDNQVVAAEPEASSTAPNEEQHLEASFPPILELGPPSDDLSAHVEHPELLEHEEITQVSLLSTADKDFEDKAEGDDATSPVPSQDRGAGEVDEIQLQYPSESDLKVPTDVEVERAESVDAADEADDISEESETDADGDDDPEYEDSSSASSVAGELDVDRDDHTIDASPEVVTGEDAGSPVPQIEDAEVPQEISNLVDTLVPEAHGTTLQPANGSIDSESEVKHVTIADPPIKAEILASKRKREHFVSKEPASISNNLGKIAESRLSRLYKPKSNGKGKKKEEEDNDDASSTSSASSAARMLNPGSRETSRASSVASVRSTRMVVESSPSVLPRVNSIIKAARPPPPKVPPPPPPAPLPPTLMHAHSHHRALPTHPPPLSRQPTQPRSIQRTPSRSNVNEEPPTPSTSSMQMPAPPRRAPPAAGSPVTRSNCRYHKIELPDDEESDQRRCFLVPGCSLGNKELMDDENIKDMGNATAEDSERMVKDLDSMHFNSYLMSNLRQLVGVDLLREQEVYYLPPPGEEPPRKPRRREQSKLRISSAGSFASEGAMSPGVRSPASVSSRAPTSAAGSSSTASAQARRRKRSDRGSPTPASWALSQGESTDDESPSAKRIRGADGEIRAAEAEGIAAAASGSPLRTRRSRRMDKEAAEYKPEGPDVGEESSGEEENKGRKKKRRGLKRGRQSEAAPAQEGGEDRKTKKLKIHESIGEGGAS
ncbi:hypothetical protein DFH09DRAFT_216569 [Mycena vulgaris]|nr:hypothetical protein DFH09DRAFT_216569 [Mycena vulgaris]